MATSLSATAIRRPLVKATASDAGVGADIPMLLDTGTSSTSIKAEFMSAADLAGRQRSLDAAGVAWDMPVIGELMLNIGNRHLALQSVRLDSSDTGVSKLGMDALVDSVIVFYASGLIHIDFGPR